MVERSSETWPPRPTRAASAWSWAKDRRSLWQWQNGGPRLFGRETCYREAASSRWGAERWGKCSSPGPREPSARRAKRQPAGGLVPKARKLAEAPLSNMLHVDFGE